MYLVSSIVSKNSVKGPLVFQQHFSTDILIISLLTNLPRVALNLSFILCGYLQAVLIVGIEFSFILIVHSSRKQPRPSKTSLLLT